MFPHSSAALLLEQPERFYGRSTPSLREMYSHRIWEYVTADKVLVVFEIV